MPYAERQAVLGRFATGMVMAQLLAGPAAGVLAELADWRLPFLLLGLFALGVGAMLAWRLLGPELRPRWRECGRSAAAAAACSATPHCCGRGPGVGCSASRS